MNPTELCLQACIHNDLETVTTLCNSHTIYIHRKNELIFKTACALDDPIPMMDILYSKFPTINLHIDDDICVKTYPSLLKWFLSKEPILEAWDDFQGLVESAIYDIETFQVILSMAPSILEQVFQTIIYNASKHNNYILFKHIFDCYRYDYIHIPIDWDRVVTLGLHEDLKIAQWLLDQGHLPKECNILFKTKWNAGSLNCCRWLITNGACIENIDETNWKQWYQILMDADYVNHVSLGMLQCALKHKLIGYDIEAFDAILGRYNTIYVDLDSIYCDEINMKVQIIDDIKVKYLPILLLISRFSRKYFDFTMKYLGNNFLYVYNIDSLKTLIKIIHTTYIPKYRYHEMIKPIDVPMRRYRDGTTIMYLDVSFQGTMIINIPYKTLFMHYCYFRKFDLCDFLLIDHVNINEIFDKCFSKCVGEYFTDVSSCKYLYQKAPELVYNYLNTYKMCIPNMDVVYWLISITHPRHPILHETLCDIVCKNIKTSDTKSDLLCLLCKQRQPVLELPCGHCFCLRSLIELRVNSNIVDTCIRCGCHYKFKDCTQYPLSRLGRLFN